jgi:hypothetical protein
MVCAAGIRLTQGRSTHLAASHTAPVAGEAVALPLAGVSRSSRPLRPAELMLPSTASARPNAGTHGRRRLERELRERSDMAAGRAPAAFSCLRSARHGEAWEASPRLERELGECSAMAAGRAPPAIS